MVKLCKTSDFDHYIALLCFACLNSENCLFVAEKLDLKFKYLLCANPMGFFRGDAFPFYSAGSWVSELWSGSTAGDLWPSEYWYAAWTVKKIEILSNFTSCLTSLNNHKNDLFSAHSHWFGVNYLRYKLIYNFVSFSTSYRQNQIIKDKFPRSDILRSMHDPIWPCWIHELRLFFRYVAQKTCDQSTFLRNVLFVFYYTSIARLGDGYSCGPWRERWVRRHTHGYDMCRAKL